MGRTWIGVGIVAVVCAIPLVGLRVREVRAAADYAEQLRLARAEGLPTNAAEFAATIPTAKPEENAAPLYRKLSNHPELKGDVFLADQMLVFRPSPQSRQTANQLLKASQSRLEVADEAVKLPKCWFDRDWSLGAAVLLPEFAQMKQAARLVMLRGSVAASHGDEKGAIEQAHRALVIAEHAGQESTGISRLIRESVYGMVLRDLSNWAFAYRDRPEYVSALRDVITQLPKPDLQQEHRDELYITLLLVDQSQTPEGRRLLGIKEEDVPTGERFAPVFYSRGKARADIVRAERAYFSALRSPQPQMQERIDWANEDLRAGLRAFPTAAALYDALWGEGEDPATQRIPRWEARRQQYVALARGLSGKNMAKSIQTSDLLSPFDGKPISYQYDGRQIVIGVSGDLRDSKPVLLKFPPDKVLKK